MRTHESMAKREILRYLAHGYDLPYSLRMAKEIHLHRLDAAADRAAKDISWFCELHQEAIEKLAFLDDWFRPSKLSARPEVIRDLLTLGIIECKHVPGMGHENTICLYKKSLNYLK